MNPLVLIAMDKNNHNKAELKSTSAAASNAAACAADAAWLDDIGCPADAALAEYWVRDYFEVTGEDEQNYIDAIEGVNNNKFIFVAMDKENRTPEELKRNVIDAAACATVNAATNAHAEYWVSRYFEITGENQQAYIEEIKGNK